MAFPGFWSYRPVMGTHPLDPWDMIRQQVDRSGLPLTWIAEQCGKDAEGKPLVRKSSLYNWMNGTHRPRTHEAAAVARVVGLRLDVRPEAWAEAVPDLAQQIERMARKRGRKPDAT
jgi:hypothetical protein